MFKEVFAALWKRPSPHATALAMIGATAGQRVVVVGADDAGLAAELALVTGLNGRTLVIDHAPEAPQRIEAAALAAGALVEVQAGAPGALPLDPGAADLVVIVDGRAVHDRAAIGEVFRALRPGGRVVAVDGTRPSGWRSLLPTPAPPPASRADLEPFTATGFRAARVLAVSEGVRYLEATKPA